MKFQNPSWNSVLNGRTDERTNGRTDERTSRKQYAPHFFKVGGIKTQSCIIYAYHRASKGRTFELIVKKVLSVSLCGVSY